MSATRIGATLALCLAMAWPAAARAQQAYELDLSVFDPVAAALFAEDVLLRAPDPDIDRLFKAVHVASRSDVDAEVMCAMFEPDADRSPSALQRAASRLSANGRQRFLDALATVAIAGLQSPRQPYDAAVAQQVVKSAGVKAMFLNDGFTAGMVAEGIDEASRRARCQSLRWLVDALDGYELSERAAATRYLLGEGLAQYRQQL